MVGKWLSLADRIWVWSLAMILRLVHMEPYLGGLGPPGCTWTGLLEKNMLTCVYLKLFIASTLK